MSDVIQTQKRNLPLLATRETCAGGTYIVTGANTGLGFEAAKHLASLGASKIILAVRDPNAGQTAKDKIEAASGTKGVVLVWPLDLSSYDSVRAFARRAGEELGRIDALIENAAVATPHRTMAEGHVVALTVNVLSTMLLATLLLPKMRDGAARFKILPRLVFVTSRAGFDVKEDWDKIKDDPLGKMDGEDLSMLKTYPLSKLLETMAVRYLASNLVPVAKTGVVANLVCPGLCKTSLSRNAPPDFVDHLRQMHAQYGRTAEDGSRTLLHGAVAGRESHGLLLHSCEIGEDVVPDWVKDDTESQKRVWDAIANELEAVEPGCLGKILD